MPSRGLGCDRGASETVLIPARDRVCVGEALVFIAAVSRRLRHRPDQRATLTPLLFEATSSSA
jgi:hypothetical protein